MGYWVTPGLQIYGKKYPLLLYLLYRHLLKVPFTYTGFLLPDPVQGDSKPLNYPSTLCLEVRLVSNRIRLFQNPSENLDDSLLIYFLNRPVSQDSGPESLKIRKETTN